MRRQFLQRLASVVVGLLLTLPLLAQDKDKAPEKAAEKPPEPPPAPVERSQGPLYTVAGLVLMLILTIVCMPTRKNN